ncbi:MAG TPA: septum formation protein Maf [Deltaproteobacteria bacterium]|nr:septum formation protein Maf [Deltaproteobacteria bacterium]
MMRLVLASISPRRRELLESLRIPFLAVAPHFEEISDSRLSPSEEALSFAQAKAESLRSDYPDAWIIGGDTLIALAGEKIGKPRDARDAERMLKKLSGKRHEIFTGLALLDAASGKLESSLSRVAIRMKELSATQIAAYVATGEALDKAGAYAIQGLGRDLIESVEGDFDAAVGLPLRELAKILEEWKNAGP